MWKLTDWMGVEEPSEETANDQGALGLSITGAGYMAMIPQFGRCHHAHLSMREYTSLNENEKLLSFVGVASDRICMHGDAICETTTEVLGRCWRRLRLLADRIQPNRKSEVLPTFVLSPPSAL